MSHLHITISISRLHITNSNSVLYTPRTGEESSTYNELYVSCTYRVLNKLSKYYSLSPPHITNSHWVLYISRTIYNSRVSHLNMSRTQCVLDTSQSQQVVYISRTRNESSTYHELYVWCTHHELTESSTHHNPNKSSRYQQLKLSPLHITNPQHILYMSRTICVMSKYHRLTQSSI